MKRLREIHYVDADCITRGVTRCNMPLVAKSAALGRPQPADPMTDTVLDQTSCHRCHVLAFRSLYPE